MNNFDARTNGGDAQDAQSGKAKGPNRIIYRWWEFPADWACISVFKNFINEIVVLRITEYEEQIIPSQQC